MPVRHAASPDDRSGHDKARRNGDEPAERERRQRVVVIEERQPHLRGGAHEPLTRADIEEKFALNARHGGWDDKRAASALKLLAGLYEKKIDLASLRG